jgi:hypothetical protein
MAYPMALMGLLVPATVERLNVKMKKAQERERSAIEAAGGLEAFNKKARRTSAFSPNEILAQRRLENSDKNTQA